MSASSGIAGSLAAGRDDRPIAHWLGGIVFRPLQILVSAPDLWFLAALLAMLFRPPDLHFYDLDRIAFGLLVMGVLLRALVLRQSLRVYGRLTLPLLGLLLLALASLAAQSYQAESWSMFAAKWVVPFALYHLAGLAFEDEVALRRFEIFSLLVLAYLTIIAILFLINAGSLIFPAFIADPNIGIHADRARGPFLQAVANGVTLNLLGLLALDGYRRRRLRGFAALLLVSALPLAVLATKTRAVWLSFALSVLAVLFFSSSSRMRRACLCLVVAGALGLLGTLTFDDLDRSLQSRLQERSPVAFRFAMYRAGWEMLLEKPLLGWGAEQMQSQLERRISDFHDDEFFFHNTYLEIGVEYGALGLALYACVIAGLFRLGRLPRGATASREGVFLDRGFRPLWPLLVGVYLLNGCFVVLNYQFVNGLVFTLAGILEAQNRRVKGGVPCGS